VQKVLTQKTINYIHLYKQERDKVQDNRTIELKKRGQATQHKYFCSFVIGFFPFQIVFKCDHDFKS
jgi:hypothetical protein